MEWLLADVIRISTHSDWTPKSFDSLTRTDLFITSSCFSHHLHNSHRPQAPPHPLHPHPPRGIKFPRLESSLHTHEPATTPLDEIWRSTVNIQNPAGCRLTINYSLSQSALEVALLTSSILPSSSSSFPLFVTYSRLFSFHCFSFLSVVSLCRRMHGTHAETSRFCTPAHKHPSHPSIAREGNTQIRTGAQRVC